jgi:hypothetical protein
VGMEYLSLEVRVYVCVVRRGGGCHLARSEYSPVQVRSPFVWLAVADRVTLGTVRSEEGGASCGIG